LKKTKKKKNFPDICLDKECQDKTKTACTKKLPCGHFCGGIKGEKQHLYCLVEITKSILEENPREEEKVNP